MVLCDSDQRTYDRRKGRDHAMRKLPIGAQDFEGLIKDGYLYADKTNYIYLLAHTGKAYF